MLSDNSRPLSVTVLLEIIMKREVPKLQHLSDGCGEKRNAHKKDNAHKNWNTYRYVSN